MLDVVVDYGAGAEGADVVTAVCEHRLSTGSTKTGALGVSELMLAAARDDECLPGVLVYTFATLAAAREAYAKGDLASVVVTDYVETVETALATMDCERCIPGVRIEHDVTKDPLEINVIAQHEEHEGPLAPPLFVMAAPPGEPVSDA